MGYLKVGSRELREMGSEILALNFMNGTEFGDFLKWNREFSL